MSAEPVGTTRPDRDEAGRASFITGDVFDVLATIPDGSVDLVLTSPPFLALRSYLPADHPDKHREIGSEPDPASFLSTLLALTAEWRRVLAPHGSICVELGDTYSGSGGAGGDYGDGGIRDGQGKFDGSGRRDRAADVAAGILQPRKRGGAKARDEIPGWPLAKSLCGIPHLYHLSLAYGRNLLTGEPCEPWRVRNVVAWCRPNPPVGALGDKFRPATSYLTIACPSGSRYFDLDAVRTTPKDYGPRYGEHKVEGIGGRSDQVANPLGPDGQRIQSNPAGAPPLDWWEIPTTPYAGAHYAAFPPALLERPIKSMAPAKVCTVCGEPSRRITGDCTLDTYRQSTRPQTIKAVALADAAGLTDEHIAAVRAFGTSDAGKATTINAGAGKNTDAVKALAAEAKTVLGGYFREFVMSSNATPDSTWTDCGHNAWRPGVILDPFGGSGTTLAVATGRGHHAIGIDLDPRNVTLARDRVGPMFLDEYTLDEWKNRSAAEVSP